MESVVNSIPEALSIYINQIVYEQKRLKKDITVLSLGEAFFDIPLYDFECLDYNKGYHYSDSQGVPELRCKIADYYRKKYDISIDSSSVLITAGSKIAIYMAIISCISPGDEVLIHEPAWLSYKEQIKLASGIPVSIPHDVSPSSFTAYISDRTKVVILNNPNNPAGYIYSKDEMEEISTIIAKNGGYLLIDEAYSDFVSDDSFYSGVGLLNSNTLVVNSLSKNFGMSGWRIGYIIAADETLKSILKLNQHLITCAPTILQLYITKYFDDILSHTLPQAQSVVAKRNIVSSYAASIGLNSLPGCATFYLMIDISSFSGSSLDFALHLLIYKHIAVVPGSAYGSSCSSYIRLGVGAESLERILDALHEIKMLIDDGAIDREQLINDMKAIGLQYYG